MELEYGLLTLKKLDTLPVGTWYPFESKNHNKDDLLEVVKLRIDLCKDFIISNDYKYFKRIIMRERGDMTGEITFKIEYDDHLVQLPYDHLPEPKYTEESKKVKRRAT